MGSLSSLRKYCITIVLFGSKDKSVWENMGIEDSELKSDSESPFLDVKERGEHFNQIYFV